MAILQNEVIANKLVTADLDGAEITVTTDVVPIDLQGTDIGFIPLFFKPLIDINRGGDVDTILFENDEFGYVSRFERPDSDPSQDYLIVIDGEENSRKTVFDYIRRIKEQISPGEEEIVTHKYSYEHGMESPFIEEIERKNKDVQRSKVIVKSNKLNQRKTVVQEGKESENFEYFPGGQLKKVKSFVGEGDWTITEYLIDVMGRNSEIQSKNSEDVIEGKMLYQYMPSGENSFILKDSQGFGAKTKYNMLGKAVIIERPMAEYLSGVDISGPDADCFDDILLSQGESNFKSHTTYICHDEENLRRVTISSIEVKEGSTTYQKYIQQEFPLENKVEMTIPKVSYPDGTVYYNVKTIIEHNEFGQPLKVINEDKQDLSRIIAIIRMGCYGLPLLSIKGLILICTMIPRLHLEPYYAVKLIMILKSLNALNLVWKILLIPLTKYRV